MKRKKRHTLFFDREAKTYDLTRDFYEVGYGGMREKKLLSLFCRGKRVINAACGTGRLLSFLAEKGFDVIGIDLSKGMLNVAKNKIKAHDNVFLIECDAEFLPIRNEAIDEIISSRAFKLFPNPLETLNEWARVLRTGGKTIISLETSDPLWIKILFMLNLRHFHSARFEWRYRIKNLQLMLRQAGFRTLFTGCVIYFGRSVYAVVERYLKPMLKFLETVDSHNKIGRNVMFVGIKE